MRTGPVLLISTIAHGVLLVLVAPTRSRQRTFVLPTLPPPPAPLPVEVVLLGGGSKGTEGTDGPAISRSRGVVRAAVARGDMAVATSDESGARGERTGPKTSLLRMRAGTDLGLDADVAERIASTPGHRGSEPYRSGRVEHRPDGTAVVHDAVTRLEVERDGTAHFHDKPYIDIKFHWPIPTWDFDIDKMRHEIGDDIAKWYADPYAGTRFGRTQDLPRHLQAVPGGCDQWADLMCDDPLAPDAEKQSRENKKKIGSFASGNLDITAWLYKKFAGDPYASRKLKLLADTADERADMGRAYRAQHLWESREIMRQNVIRLWSTITDARERRAALFALWDECAEGEGPVGEAGDRARVVVIDWIREHLPAGSPDAYTERELADFAAHRTSRQAFSPYEAR